MADFRKFLITIFRASVQKIFRITTEKNVHLDENRENISGTSGLAKRDLYKQSLAQALDSLLPVYTV